ncbi:MAG TPA: PAS domain S-box protein, partial [Aggregatilineaceae bacterium]|nr:PAS domain S-box protein [Aggregatilineaceae bacterium]
MAVPLRILFFEDQPASVELALTALREAGVDPVWRLVETEQDCLDHYQAQQYLEVAGVIFVVIDADQTVRVVNRKGCEILGYEEDEILGKNWFDGFLPDQVREETRAVFDSLMAGEVEPVEYFENPVLARNGDERIIAWHNTVLRDESGHITGTLSSGEDVTERKRAEQESRRLNRAYQTLSECNQILVRATDEKSLLQQVCQVIVKVGEYPLAWVGYAMQDESGTVLPVGWAGVQDGYLDSVSIARQDAEGGPGPTEKAIRTGKPAVVRSIETDSSYSPWREEALRRGYRSSIALPLANGEDVFGALNIYADKPDAFDSEELRLLTELTDDLAYGIVALRTREQRYQAEEALRREHDMLEHITETSPVGITVVGREGRIIYANARAEQILGLTKEEITRRTYNAPAWHITDHEGNPVPDAELPFARVMATGQPVYGVIHAIQHPAGQRALLSINGAPLMDEMGRVERVVFAIEDITARSQVEEAERQQRILAEALSAAAAAINTSLDMEHVLSSILASVERVLPHDAANIMLAEEGVVRIAAHRGYAERGLGAWIEHLSWPVTELPGVRYMVETGKPLAIPDVRAYSGWVRVPESEWLRSFASAPIFAEGQVIGCLNLDSAAVGFYTQAHAERLQAFASQASVAIKNARLYDAVQRYAADLEQRVAERTQALQESEARYRAIVEDQTELITRFLPDFTLTFVNQACCQFLDKTPEELIGRGFLSFIPDEDHELVKQHIAGLSPANPVVLVEHRVRTPGGAVRWLQWTNRLIVDAQGQCAEIQGVGRDITERRQVEEVLRKALAREMELGELKSRFVSMVSHEFRTPLAVILMNADMLRRYSKRLSESQKEQYLGSIHSSIKHMADLLDDVLVIGRAEAGKMEFNPEQVNLRAFSEEIINEIKTTSEPSLVFTFSVTGHCTGTNVDRKLWQLIVSNLVSNAAKYSLPGGAIRISVGCETDQIVLRIQDEGIGIPKRDQRHLF